MAKFLIIRLSSIGDIVLTTPVVRMLKQQVENAEIHFLTKKGFTFITENNPYIDQTIALDNNLKELIPILQSNAYDHIIDLHNNIRTRRIKTALGIPSFTVDKLNIKKWVLVHFKKNFLPNISIVDRYLDTLSVFDIEDDKKGLDYFIPQKDIYSIEQLPQNFHSSYNTMVIGGTYYTKQIPINKIVDIINQSTLPIVLLGGKDDVTKSDTILKEIKDTKKVYNLCGKINLNQSASVIQQSKAVITSDTGLMHIASALQKPILSLWGNTVPEFGMAPYMPHHQSKIFEVALSCRPCSKIGFTKCPKKHFDCMHLIHTDDIINHLKNISNS